jgi:hypothetical protein
MHGHLNVRFFTLLLFISVKSSQKYLYRGVGLVTYIVSLRTSPHLQRIFVTWKRKKSVHCRFLKVLWGLSKAIPQLSYNNNCLNWTKQSSSAAFTPYGQWTHTDTHRLVQFFKVLSVTADWCATLCGHDRRRAYCHCCSYAKFLQILCVGLERGWVGMFCYSFFQNFEQKHPVSCRRRVLASLSLPRELWESAAKCFCFGFFICVYLVTPRATSPIDESRDICRGWAHIETNVSYCLWGSSQ